LFSAKVMVAQFVVFVLSAAIVISSGVAQEVVPLVLWHGIGGSCCDPHHLGQLIALIEKEVPGIYIHSISFGKNPTEDVFFSFYGLLSDQVVNSIVEQIASRLLVSPIQVSIST
jgi:hypothetical protein